VTSGGAADLDLSRLEFRFAKTMPTHPHEYTVRTAENEATYTALFRAIREHGVDEYFQKRRYRYLYTGGWKYWAMTTDARQSRVINRAKVGADLDDLGPDLSGVGWLDGWSVFSAAEKAEALIADAAHLVAEKRRAQRRERAREIATIKAMQRAGLPVRRAVVDGVPVELGQPEPPAENMPEVEITTPEQLRRLI
jgi:hypothetical protein